MTKRTKITFIAVVVAIILSVAAFASVRNSYTVNRAMGGEGLLLVIPLITYCVCKNITTSIDVLSNPAKEDIDQFDSQIISEPHKVNEDEPRLVLIMGNKKDMCAEDHTT